MARELQLAGEPGEDALELAAEGALRVNDAAGALAVFLFTVELP